MGILDIDVWGYHNIKLMKMIISERKREYHAHITRQMGDCCSQRDWLVIQVFQLRKRLECWTSGRA